MGAIEPKPVLELSEVLDDEHWRDRGVFARYADASRGQQTRMRALGRDFEPSGLPERELERTLFAFGLSPDEVSELMLGGGVSRPDQEEATR